jgi:hypothetical protein
MPVLSVVVREQLMAVAVVLHRVAVEAGLPQVAGLPQAAAAADLEVVVQGIFIIITAIIPEDSMILKWQK